MKKYIILRGENKSGIACFDDRREKIAINLEDCVKLGKDEYFAVYADGKCIGKTIGGKAAFKTEGLPKKITVVREKTGGEQMGIEYVSEETINHEENEKTEKKEENTEETIKRKIEWRKIRGYYCIKNIEIAKYVMSGENIYSAINEKGYYLFGEVENIFAIAVPPLRGHSPFGENVDKFAEKMRVMGSEYYVVFMGTDENGEYFLKSAEDK